MESLHPCEPCGRCSNRGGNDVTHDMFGPMDECAFVLSAAKQSGQLSQGSRHFPGTGESHFL